MIRVSHHKPQQLNVKKKKKKYSSLAKVTKCILKAGYVVSFFKLQNSIENVFTKMNEKYCCGLSFSIEYPVVSGRAPSSMRWAVANGLQSKWYVIYLAHMCLRSVSPTNLFVEPLA